MKAVTTTQFFDQIFAHLEHGWLNLFSINPTTGQRHVDWYTTNQTAEMAAQAAAIGDTRDVWYGMASRTHQLDQGRRGGKEDCKDIGALWADIDIAGTNHANVAGQLPTDDNQARQMIRDFPLKPSIIVASGNGYHLYWLLAEPMAVDDATTTLDRWAATWAHHATTHGCAVDNVFDLPRVLRVPNTINHKNGERKPVTILTWTDTRYQHSDIYDNTISPPDDPQHTNRHLPYTGHERPGDDYNARHTGGDVLALAGWQQGKTKHDNEQRWLHPWQPTSDESATVYNDGHTTIWSDTVPRHCTTITTRRPYDPFGLYTNLIHQGDWTAATTELAKQGYGAAGAHKLNGTTTDTGKHVINVGGRQLDDITNDIVHHLHTTNTPPHLFRHGQAVSQYTRGELAPIDRVRLVNVIETRIAPMVNKKAGQTTVMAPARVETSALDLTMLRLLDLLPPVQGVVRAPFLRADGTVCAQLGYDPASGNYLATTSHTTVPQHPTPQQVQDAVDLIDDMIHDFPLPTSPDRAHIFALLLTPLIRHLVPLTPLFVLDGNGPGVGKNLLAESCMYITTGEWVQTDPLPLDTEEQRKQITALLSTGRSVAMFDEAHIVGGTSLARLITSTTWGDRLLGYSRQVSYPNRITVVALGNNVEIQGDMPRRTIMIRLQSELAHPYDRQDFRHNDLRIWVEQNRDEMLAALLTLLVAWHQAGRPAGADRLGSFDQWAAIIGGTLTNAGVEGFLTNLDAMRERGASDDIDMQAHLENVYERAGTDPFTTRTVARWIDDDFLDALPPRLSNDKNRHSQSLGHIYRRCSGRWLGGIRIDAVGVTDGAKRWALQRHNPTPVDNPVDKVGLRGLRGSPSTYARENNSQYSENGEPRSFLGEAKTGPLSPLSPLSPNLSQKPPRVIDPDELF